MNKLNFMDTLQNSLRSLDAQERKKFLDYYEEIFEDYKENGLTEEEVIKKIGTPQSIANDILNNYDTIEVKATFSENKLINIALLVLGFPLWGSLLLASVLSLFSFYIVLWCIPFTTAVSSVAFFAASLISIIGSPLVMSDIFGVGLTQLGTGIASLGLSILLAIATIYISKKFIFITKSISSRLLKIFNKKVVRI